jgi:hypothetical protein
MSRSGGLARGGVQPSPYNSAYSLYAYLQWPRGRRRSGTRLYLDGTDEEVPPYSVSCRAEQDAIRRLAGRREKQRIR